MREKMSVGAFTWVSIFAIGAMIVNSVGIWFVYKNIEWAEKTRHFLVEVFVRTPGCKAAATRTVNRARRTQLAGTLLTLLLQHLFGLVLSSCFSGASL